MAFTPSLDGLPEAVIAVTLQEHILFWNRAAEAIFGVRRDVAIGKNVMETIVAPEHVVEARDRFQRALRTGELSFEYRCRRADGSPVHAELYVQAVDDAAQPHVMICVRDVTQQKRQQALEDELRDQNRRMQETNRLKSEFLANMSHELRTPLHAIIGFAEIMHSGKVGPVSSDHKEYLGDILTSSRHLLQLINDVLDLAKIESGTVEFNFEAIEVGRIVAEVRDVLRAVATVRHIVIESQVDGKVSLIADASKLRQVLFNYLSNALKFTPEGGRVMIRVRLQGDEAIRFEVEDTGIGIAPEDVDRLFVEFQQLDVGAGKRFQGTGLGLALTKRLVEAQGGTVGVDHAPGGGAIFYAVLPRQPRVVSRPPVARDPHEPRILIVQRESRERDWLQRALERAGYQIELAASPEEALARCRGQTFGAITIEALFPDTLGRDLLSGIRSGGPNRETPVMMVAVSVDQDSGTAMAVQDVVEKPSQAQDMLDLMRRTALPIGAAGPILVVDDDPMALKLAETVLGKEGFAVRCSSNPVEALAMALTAPPSLVVLDLLMARMDGFEFLDRLRRNPSGRRIPVIIWTEKTITGADRAALTAAAQAVVLKTHGTSALLDEVQALVPVGPHGR